MNLFNVAFQFIEISTPTDQLPQGPNAFVCSNRQALGVYPNVYQVAALDGISLQS